VHRFDLCVLNKPMSIDISGLNKAELLHKLWQEQYIAPFFILHNVRPPNFDKNEADKAVGEYIDYFSGRCIKTDLSKNVVDPQYYDECANKPGLFAKIVQKLRRNNDLEQMHELLDSNEK